MGQPTEDYADVIGRLLVRVYEIHERVLTKGGGGTASTAIIAFQAPCEMNRAGGIFEHAC